MSNVYKFLHSRDVDRLLVDGTVKIASLSHYRKLEGEQWIADRIEGGVHIPVTEELVLSGDGEGDKALRKTTPPGFSPPVQVVPGGVKLKLMNLTLRFSGREVFIFCASIGTLATLQRIMTRGASAYDACIRISDIGHLAHRLLQRGRIIELNNARVSSVFGATIFEPVRYESLMRPPGAEQLPAPSPFLKDMQFAPQSEIRIVFYPKPGVAPTAEVFTIRIEDPTKFFVVEFSSVALPPASPAQVASLAHPA